MVSRLSRSLGSHGGADHGRGPRCTVAGVWANNDLGPAAPNGGLGVEFTGAV